MGTARELKYNDEQLRGLVDGFIRNVRTKVSVQKCSKAFWEKDSTFALLNQKAKRYDK